MLATAAPSAARPIADPEDDGGGGAGGGTGAGYVAPVDGFNWSAPDRFQSWSTNWVTREDPIVYPNELYKKGYVNPTKWNISVQGCVSLNDYIYSRDPVGYAEMQEEDPENSPTPTTLYKWEWDGNSSEFSSKCYGNIDFPAEGTYFVTVTTKSATGVEKIWRKSVEVKDFLIVVLGDSSASGEGASDTKVTDTARAKRVDNRCHRSNNSGSAQAAKRIENGSSHSSVTYISFACSGATMATKIYNGKRPTPTTTKKTFSFVVLE